VGLEAESAVGGRGWTESLAGLQLPRIGGSLPDRLRRPEHKPGSALDELKNCSAHAE